MKKHSLIINPLNSGYGTGLNSMGTFVETEYESEKTSRKVLFYEPLKSYFKLKSVGQTAYIEPVFCGLSKGDMIEVELQALAVGDTGETILSIQVGDTASSGGSAKMQRHSMTIKHSDFRKYSIKFPLETNIMDNPKAVFLNIRNNKNNSELIIKDVLVTIHTSNPNFVIEEDYIYLKEKKDFIKAIKNGSRIDNIDYSEMDKSLRKGVVEISEDGVLTCNPVRANGFRGVALRIGDRNVPEPIAVYFEYKSNNDNNLKVKAANKAGISLDEILLPASPTWKKRLLFIQTYNNVPLKNIALEIGIGQTVPVAEYSIRNVIIYNKITQTEAQNSLDKYIDFNHTTELAPTVPFIKKFLIKKNNSLVGNCRFEFEEQWLKDVATLSIFETPVSGIKSLRLTYKESYKYGTFPIAIAQVAGDTGEGWNSRAARSKLDSVDVFFFDETNKRRKPDEVPNGTYIYILVMYS